MEVSAVNSLADFDNWVPSAELNFKEDFILLCKLIEDGEIELEPPLLGE